MADRTTNSVNSVTIKLSADGDQNPDTIIFPDRKIQLTRSQTTLAIGRASKVASKGFIASKNSAWFDNQVMSRNHALISADFGNKDIKIQDTGSLHGTYLNDVRLHKDKCMVLQDGDKVRFGIPVLRGQDSFAPTCVKVGIVFGTSTTKRATTPDNTFKVPDGSVISDDEDIFPSDEPVPGSLLPQRKIPQPDLIDLTEVSSSKAGYPTIIDITSPPGSPEIRPARDDSNSATPVNNLQSHANMSDRSPSPDLGGDEQVLKNTMTMATLMGLRDQAIDPYEDFLSDEYMDEPYQDGTSDSDNDSIRLSTDEDDEEDEEEDMSEHDSLQSDSQSEMRSEDESEEENNEDDDLDSRELESDIGWEGDFGWDDQMEEQQMVLQDLENWKHGTGPSGGIQPSPLSVPVLCPATSIAHTTEMTAVVATSCRHLSHELANPALPQEPFVAETNSPTKKLASVSIEELLNSNRPACPENGATPRATVPPVVISSVVSSNNIRQPSPSDAALAKSFASHGPPASFSMGSLIIKSGKPEFFAAREENKSKAAKMAGHPQGEHTGYTSEPNQDSQHSQPTHGPFTVQPNASPPTVSKSATMDAPSGKDILSFAQSDWYERGADFLKTPIPNIDLPNGSTYDDDEAMTSAYTFQQHKLKQTTSATQDKPIPPPPARTHVGISDIVDSCQGISGAKTNGKRKADEITGTLSPAEEQYETALKEKGTTTGSCTAAIPLPICEPIATCPSAPESDAESTALKAVSLDLTEVPQAIVSQSSDVTSYAMQPAKRRRLRKIVERVGYAALGGVTVGAMVVGSLIYTAPAF